MRKIFGIIVAVSAFLASCTSPYYPEYVSIVSLGANTSALVCESNEGTASLKVISNVDYSATLISGTEWLNFVDTPEAVRYGSGNTVLVFKHKKNNVDKRVAYLVLAAENRTDTVKIKQKSIHEDYLQINADDKATYFTVDNGARMSVPEAGGDYELRLTTSCLDEQISFWTDRTDALVDFKVVNGIFSFRAKENLDGQPRIMTIRLSYIDGWDDVRSLDISIRQQFDPLN